MPNVYEMKKLTNFMNLPYSSLIVHGKTIMMIMIMITSTT